VEAMLFALEMSRDDITGIWQGTYCQSMLL